jgi:uncharacterized protein (DUF362 family)
LCGVNIYMSERVVIARAGTYDQAIIAAGISEVLSSLGGITRFVASGEKVLLKPNMLEGLPPVKAVTTHPWMVHEVLFSKELLFPFSEKCGVFQ